MSIFLDLETSGLSPAHGAVILSIGLIHDEGELNSHTNELELYICPSEEEWAQASPEALAVNGLTYDFLKENGVSLQGAIDHVCEWLVGHRIWLGTEVIGQNPDFDYRFLSYWMGMPLVNIGFPLHRNAINVIDLARDLADVDPTFRVMTNEKGRPSFKGSNISMALGLPPEPPIHKALAGAQACRQNYYRLIERLSKAKRTIRI